MSVNVHPVSANPVSVNIASAERSMQICNACRYCESLCAVFPAMTDMRTFDTAKLDYLANLCHQCGACFQACQYAPPHPFSVNVKQALSEQRSETYERYNPVGFLWRLTERAGIMAGLVLSTVFSLILIIATWIKSPDALFGTFDGDFYLVMPHSVMAALGGLTLAIGLGGLIVAGIRFWRSYSPEDDAGQSASDSVLEDDAGPATTVSGKHWQGALGDGMSLRYLSDDLCLQERGTRRHWQRRLHHLMTVGFTLCFVATLLGTVYHYLFGWVAPYTWHSLPALAGTVGGLMMAIGTTGLMLLKMRSPSTGDEATRSMDISLVFLLWGVAVTGLALRLLGDSPALAVTLMIHLGFVFAFFVSLPFSKMLHVPLRLLALLRYQLRSS